MLHPSLHLFFVIRKCSCFYFLRQIERVPPRPSTPNSTVPGVQKAISIALAPVQTDERAAGREWPCLVLRDVGPSIYQRSFGGPQQPCHVNFEPSGGGVMEAGQSKDSVYHGLVRQSAPKLAWLKEKALELVATMRKRLLSHSRQPRTCPTKCSWRPKDRESAAPPFSLGMSRMSLDQVTCRPAHG